MVWYADGSIQVEANGQVATGTGTAFLKNVRIGDGLTIAGSASMHEVTNIASDTQLTFSPPYAGAAGAGKQYRIAPVQGYVKEAADRLREVLREAGPLITSKALQALADADTDQERRAVVALGQVDNTADVDKPVSKAVAEALAGADQKNPELVGQAEAEAGTGTSIRGWPVVRVWQSAAAWFGQSGYKVQRGSNVNGEFVKFPDGTLICTGVMRMPAQAISTDNIVTLNFPAAFVSTAYNLQLTPKTVIGSGSQDAIGSMLYNGVYTGSHGTSSMTVASYAYRSAVSNPIDFYFTVTGRWK